MVKNISILVLLGLLILILFGLNQEFGWIEFQWKSMAIAISALAAPFQYFKNWMEQRNEDKEMQSEKYKYRVLNHNEFIARENNNTTAVSSVPTKGVEEVTNTFDIENSVG